MKCSRTACQVEMDGPHVAIWNQPSTNQPRLYCVRCGRKIIEANRSDEIKLKYEYRKEKVSGLESGELCS